MSDVSFTNSMELLLNESLQETSELRSQLNILANKNEEYQQKIHVLRLELDTKDAMYKEIKELLDDVSSQQSYKIDQTVRELTKKHNHERECYEKRIEELEEELILKVNDNEIMRQNIENLKGKLQLPPIQEQSHLEELTEQHNDKIVQLEECLVEKEKKVLYFAELCKNHEDHIFKLETMIKDLKVRLEEKDQIIESNQEELAECRTELQSLKAVPADNIGKGNSLFAEVEDRRQIMMEKMNAMRTNYHEMKKSYLSKENEIKLLKSERAALIRKWEDSSAEAIEQETSLIQAYRNRITELENKLKEEQKKYRQMEKETQSDHNISYFQSLITSKKKEIEELQMKIENNAIRTLLEEEKCYKYEKRLRYWRYKAMTLEASLLAVKDELETDPNSTSEKVLEMIKNQTNEKNLQIDIDNENLEFSVNLNEMKSSHSIIIKTESSIINSLYRSDNSAIDLMNQDKSSKMTILSSRDNNSTCESSSNLRYLQLMDYSMPSSSSIEERIKTEKLDQEDFFETSSTSTSSSLENKRNREHMEFVSINQESNLDEEDNQSAISINTSMLKSSLVKSRNEQEENREKKTLRFASETAKDSKEGLLKRMRDQQKKYPIVFISSKSNQ